MGLWVYCDSLPGKSSLPDSGQNTDGSLSRSSVCTSQTRPSFWKGTAACLGVRPVWEEKEGSEVERHKDPMY